MSKINKKLSHPNTTEEQKDCENQLKELELKKERIIAEYASKSKEEINGS